MVSGRTTKVAARHATKRTKMNKSASFVCFVLAEWPSWFPFARALESERGAEPQLQHPRCVGHVRILLRLAESGVALVGHPRVDVGPVERVEDLEDPVNGRFAAQPEPPLDAHVHALDRLAVEAVSRDERAVGAQTSSGVTDGARVDARARRVLAVVAEQ